METIAPIPHLMAISDRIRHAIPHVSAISCGNVKAANIYAPRGQTSKTAVMTELLSAPVSRS